MKIGIDAYPLIRKTKVGISYYTEYLLNSLLNIDNKSQYSLYNYLEKRIQLNYNGSGYLEESIVYDIFVLPSISSKQEGFRPVALCGYA